MADYRKLVEEGSVSIAIGEIEGRRRGQEDSLQFAVNDIQEFSQLNNDAQATALKNTLAEIQTATQEMACGSTANTTVAWLDESRNVRATTANLGDSTSFLVILDNNNNLVSSKLMHKLHNPDRYANYAEYSRVVKQAQQNNAARPPGWGGPGDTWRLGSGLAVSRSLGDHDHEEFGLSHDPELTHTKVKLAAGQKAFIVVACDGLTELNENDKPALTPKAIGEIVAEGQQKNSLYVTMDKLIIEAYCGGSQDNISVAVFPVGDKPISAAIFDGHGGVEVAKKAGEMFYPQLKKHIEVQLKLQEAARLELQLKTVEKITGMTDKFVAEMTQEILKALLASNLKKDLIKACASKKLDDKTTDTELTKTITKNHTVTLQNFIIEQSLASKKLPVKLQHLMIQHQHGLALQKAMQANTPTMCIDNAKALFKDSKVRRQLEKGQGFWGKIFQLLGWTPGQQLGKFFDKNRKILDSLPQPKTKAPRLG
jgi:serine/threonine protein phosphatase PrpC